MANTTASSLESKDHKLLMDIIDGMRSKGISRYVDLPQIVVCGDQSSGKSSVLQAISGMSFPIKDNICTRFPTELILRRTGQNSEEKCRISIHPGSDRSSDERKKLEAFQYSEIPEQSNIAAIVEEAKNAIGLSDQGKRFSHDVLRIELSGPAQPHLTIVDLPGLFRTANKEQSADEAAIVKELVLSYIKNPRSIILAVVSAMSQFVLQDVTEFTRKIDPRGLRTLGLITKPDMLDEGSNNEQYYFDLAQNRDVHFRLGWHVVRNRGFKTQGATNAERDQAEREFMARGIWSRLPSNQKGAAALQNRLSEVLKDHILEQLPELLREVESGLQDCTNRLHKLGDARGTLEQQRKYLLHASHQFSSLIKAAIGGVYGDPFFGSARDDGDYKKRLRAVVQNLLTEFAETMGSDGRARVIVENAKPSVLEVSRDQYLTEVKELMKKTRGCELPGTFNPLIVGDLFQEQCKPWKGWIEDYSEEILEAVDYAINSVLGHVVDETTSAELWKGMVYEGFETLKRDLNKKVAEILQLHASGHPITYNQNLTEIVQKQQKKRARAAFEERLKRRAALEFGGSRTISMRIDDLLDIFMAHIEAGMETYACSGATDMMEAYYEVALKRVVDDFSDLAIEACLISKLPTLFTPERVIELADYEILRIAGESAEIAMERITLTDKKNILSEGQRELKRQSRHHQPTSSAGDTPEEKEDI